MRRARVGELLGILAAMAACQSAPASKQEGSGSASAPTGTSEPGRGGSTSGTSGVANVGGNGSSLDNAGGKTGGGNVGVAGGVAVGTGGVPEVTTKLTLTGATARIGGRKGNQLVITVDGKAAVGVLGSIEVGLLDAAGNGLAFFDSNWDGAIDSHVGRIQPTKPPTTETFSLEATLSDIQGLGELTKLQLALFDREDRRTEPILVSIQPQPIIELAGGCDPQYITNRCREGLTCAGSSPACLAGTAPTIAHAAFQRGTEGPSIRVDGLDPDEDVILMLIEFLTTTDAPIALDLDGDEVPDADHLEVDVGFTNENGGYRFVVESGQGFETQVPRLGLTAIDSKGNRSPTQVVNISNRTMRTSGQTCDIAGFVGCVSGTTCLPGTSGTAYCSTYTQAETSRCGGAPVWDLAKDPLKIAGLISGYSAWEAPAGCLSSTSINRPEYVIKMRLPQAMPKLILSTAEPETGLDTGLVVLPSCTADPTKALACNDDSTGYTSTVTLTDLAAGDYFVIVEAVQSEGGPFGLSARTQ